MQNKNNSFSADNILNSLKSKSPSEQKQQIENLKSSLNPQQSENLKSILSDKNKLREILSSSQAKDILSKLGK